MPETAVLLFAGNILFVVGGFIGVGKYFATQTNKRLQSVEDKQHNTPCREMLEFENTMSQTTGRIDGKIEVIMTHLEYLRKWAENGGNGGHKN